ncbi:monovalent cation/H(+) antiporter subunit G [Oryzifoliimicrobium ureilyticus]|uniref:monovalent cation/H(+) antiporter subunit G n=1 Tax=Oryzifoliimicrobium ureilyticus TaxID=3113724 RepID=UPI00307643D9
MIETAGELPDWAALMVAFFLLIGGAFTLIGAIGFLRFPSFYERLHSPTLGTSLGVGGVLIASMIFFSATSSRVVLHEILIGIFITVTTPVTLMLLARAALHRDRAENNGNIPAKHDRHFPTD